MLLTSTGAFSYARTWGRYIRVTVYYTGEQFAHLVALQTIRDAFQARGGFHILGNPLNLSDLTWEQLKRISVSVILLLSNVPHYLDRLGYQLPREYDERLDGEQYLVIGSDRDQAQGGVMKDSIVLHLEVLLSTRHVR